MGKELGKSYVSDHTPLKCYRDFCVVIILILSAVAIPFFALNGYLIPKNELMNTWFQRSGSVTVLLSLVAEYIITRLHSILKPSGFTSIGTEGIRNKLESPLMFLRYFGAISAVGGTIIWGYGDLMVSSA